MCCTLRSRSLSAFSKEGHTSLRSCSSLFRKELPCSLAVSSCLRVILWSVRKIALQTWRVFCTAIGSVAAPSALEWPNAEQKPSQHRYGLKFLQCVLVIGMPVAGQTPEIRSPNLGAGPLKLFLVTGFSLLNVCPSRQWDALARLGYRLINSFVPFTAGPSPLSGGKVSLRKTLARSVMSSDKVQLFSNLILEGIVTSCTCQVMSNTSFSNKTGSNSTPLNGPLVVLIVCWRPGVPFGLETGNSYPLHNWAILYRQECPTKAKRQEVLLPHHP